MDAPVTLTGRGKAPPVLRAVDGIDLSVKRGEVLGAHLLVAAIEPDVALRRRILDRELVLRGTARVLAGLHDERAVLGKETFLARHSLFDERGGAQVPVKLRPGGNTLFIKGEGGNRGRGHVHSSRIRAGTFAGAPTRFVRLASKNAKVALSAIRFAPRFALVYWSIPCHPCPQRSPLSTTTATS